MDGWMDGWMDGFTVLFLFQGAFSGSSLSGIGGPAIELKASESIKIGKCLIHV